MLYTIGHRANYLKSFEECTAQGGYVLKVGKTANYPGGYVLLSIEDARRLIAELEEPEFSVFGLDCDISDTEPATDGWWLNLLTNAQLIWLDIS